MQELKVDPRWTVFEEYSSFPQFTEALIPKTVLVPTVEKGIQDYYNVVIKLLHFSYYEYEFVTVSLRNCLPLLEYSLNHYYAKHTGEDFKGSLSKLINWYRAEKIFNKESLEAIDMVRHIRNHYMHPRSHVVAPPAVAGIIEMIVVMINDLEEKYMENS